MWLEAVLTTDDLAQILRQFAPLEIRLGDEGSLLLDEPSEVSLLVDRGMRVVCGAKLRWPLLGIVIPVGLRSLAVVVVPVVEEREGQSLVFRIHVEHIDVSLVPTVIDDKITARVNEELAKHQVSLAWPFLQTLSHTFALPAALASVASLALLATGGSVRISENAIRFTVAFQTDVLRRTGEPPSSQRPSESKRADRAAPPASSKARDSVGIQPPALPEAPTQVLGVLTALAASALAGAYALGRVSVRRRHRWL